MLDAAIESAGATGRERSVMHGHGLVWRRWRGLARVAAGLLALVVFGGASVASATEAREWPTSPDNGPGQGRQCGHGHGHGAGGMAVLAVMPEEALAAGEVVYVAERQELTRRQKRLLRRAERHARKAAKLRAKSGADDRQVVVVARPAMRVPTSYAVVRGGQVVPVRVVGAGCEVGEPRHRPKIVVAQGEAPRVAVARRAPRKEHGPEGLDAAALAATIERELAGIDLDGLADEVSREVERALREVERAHARVDAAQAKATRHAERAERKAEQARRRGEAVQREVDRALRDGVIDGEERRRIGEAARAAARER